MFYDFSSVPKISKLFNSSSGAFEPQLPGKWLPPPTQLIAQFSFSCFVTFLFLQNQNSSVKLNNVAINSSNYKDQIQRNTSKDEMHFMKQRNDAYMTKLITAQQKRMPSEVNHQHHPLARTVSTPMPIPDANQAVSNLFSSLNDILNAGAATGHRKLERTQSEPIPQTNTSR